MPRKLLLALCALCLSSHSFAQHTGPAACYPDPAKTPGCSMPGVTADAVTRDGYTESVRDVSKLLKWQVFRLYDLAPDQDKIDLAQLRELEQHYEIDHFISLELGGSNDIKNLWPQPYAGPVVSMQTLGARQKDVVETALHRLIKKGEITLEQAQKIILTDWVKAYFEIKAGRVPSP